ncbi:MAG: hypothetical protein RLZ84_1220 [Actinomycetota bacterium]
MIKRRTSTFPIRVVLLLIASVSLVGCGASNGEIPDTYSGAPLAETTVVDTTAPPIAMSDLPKETPCPLNDIRRDTGDVYKEVVQCVPGWAVGIPKKVLDAMNGDSVNEGERVLKLTETGWKTVGVCHIYHPIELSGVWCSTIDGDDVDTTLLPPMNVQCVLWDASRWSENIAETGCPNPEN